MRPIRAIAIAAFAFGLTLSMAPLAQADGGQYTVLKCHAYSRSASEVEAAAAGPYQTADSCAGADHRLEIAVDGFGLPGQSGYVRFTAPDNTAIVGVIADANLRRDNHHFAQLAAVDYQGNSRVLAQGSDSGTGFQPYSFSGLNDLRFVVQLFCSDPGGCPNSSQAHAYVRNIALVLEDRSAPGVLTSDGSLLEGGWMRGYRDLQAAAVDLGSGLVEPHRSRLTASRLGRTLGCPWRVSGGTATAYLVPCPVAPHGTQLAVTVDTASRAIHARAPIKSMSVPSDFAGNSPICRSVAVSVDNQAPQLSFASQPRPADPELIRVTERWTCTRGRSETSVRRSRIRPRVGLEWTALPTRLAGTTP